LEVRRNPNMRATKYYNIGGGGGVREHEKKCSIEKPW